MTRLDRRRFVLVKTMRNDARRGLKIWMVENWYEEFRDRE